MVPLRARALWHRAQDVYDALRVMSFASTLQTLRSAELTSKNWLVHELVRQQFARVFPLYLRGKLVDIGCGLKPYAKMAEPYVADHIGVDHPTTVHGTSNVDIAATAYAIPVADATFDSALCSAVLEHLDEPEAAIRECFRVLKPGAHAIYTVPLIWHLHEEPRDFYRYTKHGLAHLLQKAGFEVVEITPMSGFWVTFGQLGVYMLYRRRRNLLRRLGVVPHLGGAIQLGAWALDRLDRADQWTWAYLAVARKPSEPAQQQAPA